MLDGGKVLAVIAGRGGSKGLPRKNVLPVDGQPMIAWSVAAAQGASLVDRTILSSDDPDIIAAARAAGCEVPFVRPPELASDQASIYDVLFHALDHVGETFAWVVLLQATSPLRTSADIDATLSLCADGRAPAAISVCPPSKSPYWMYSLDDSGHLHRLLDPPAADARRQDLPETVVPNGAVYVARTDWLRKTRNFVELQTRAYVMPPERSVDVDSRLDWLLADLLARERNNPA